MFGYKRDGATGMVTKHTSRQLGYMYGHMTRDGRLRLVGIFTHTAAECEKYCLALLQSSVLIFLLCFHFWEHWVHINSMFRFPSDKTRIA